MKSTNLEGFKQRRISDILSILTSFSKEALWFEMTSLLTPTIDTWSGLALLLLVWGSKSCWCSGKIIRTLERIMSYAFELDHKLRTQELILSYAFFKLDHKLELIALKMHLKEEWNKRFFLLVIHLYSSTCKGNLSPWKHLSSCQKHYESKMYQSTWMEKRHIQLKETEIQHPKTSKQLSFTLW